MVSSEIIKKWSGWGCFAVVLFLLSACGEVRCGGGANTGSCLRIENIQPGDGKNKNSSNVDAFQQTCNAFEVAAAATSTPVKPVFEVFSDHSAQLTISNRRLPGVKADDISDVTLDNFAIVYSSNSPCPAGAFCAPLTTFSAAPGETVVIKADTEFSFTLPFVPLSRKAEYVAAIMALPSASARDLAILAVPSYTATYIITGTDSFKNKVSVTGSAEFTIGAFDNC